MASRPAHVTPRVWAAVSAPTEHQGISANALVELSADTVQATIGLESYTSRMRAIGVAPGGQIVLHNHADRPGTATMVQGERVEGQPNG